MSIPTCIVVLKKHRDGRDVLFIDASQKFDKGKKQNTKTDKELAEAKGECATLMKSLSASDNTTQESLNKFIGMLGG